MVSWRCPHCGAPQPEAARCWVCHLSTTSCASCRHYRRAVSLRLGYCALDKHRTPLTGEEERACWERSPAEAVDAADPAASESADAAVTGGHGLWGTPIPTDVPPDRAALGHGMWTGPDTVEKTDGPRHQHGSSIRSRPWGRVPGLTEPTGWRRGIRQIGGKG